MALVDKYAKKEALKIRQKPISQFSAESRDMKGMPGAMFVDPKKEKIAVKEAAKCVNPVPGGGTSMQTVIQMMLITSSLLMMMLSELLS